MIVDIETVPGRLVDAEFVGRLASWQTRRDARGERGAIVLGPATEAGEPRIMRMREGGPKMVLLYHARRWADAQLDEIETVAQCSGYPWFRLRGWAGRTLAELAELMSGYDRVVVALDARVRPEIRCIDAEIAD